MDYFKTLVGIARAAGPGGGGPAPGGEAGDRECIAEALALYAERLAADAADEGPQSWAALEAERAQRLADDFAG